MPSRRSVCRAAFCNCFAILLQNIRLQTAAFGVVRGTDMDRIAFLFCLFLLNGCAISAAIYKSGIKFEGENVEKIRLATLSKFAQIKELL